MAASSKLIYFTYVQIYKFYIKVVKMNKLHLPCQVIKSATQLAVSPLYSCFVPKVQIEFRI